MARFDVQCQFLNKLKLAWLDIGEELGGERGRPWVSDMMALRLDLLWASLTWSGWRRRINQGKIRWKIALGRHLRGRAYLTKLLFYHPKTAHLRPATDKLLELNYFLCQECAQTATRLLLLASLIIFKAKLADACMQEISSILTAS